MLAINKRQRGNPIRKLMRQKARRMTTVDVVSFSSFVFPFFLLCFPIMLDCCAPTTGSREWPPVGYSSVALVEVGTGWCPMRFFSCVKMSYVIPTISLFF